MTMGDPEVRKLEARNARLRVARDKSIATKVTAILREAIVEVEKMEPDEGLVSAVDHLTQAADALCAWTPKGT